MNPKSSKKQVPKVEIKKKVKNGPKKVEKCKVDKKKMPEVPVIIITTKNKVLEVPSKVIEEPKKLERSNSFFLTRKLSKIFHLSASKENLNKLDETKSVDNNGGFKFQRSLTLNSIQLKKNYRNNFEKLGKLSEEKIGDSEKVKKQSDHSPCPPSSPVMLRSQSPATYRQTLPANHNYDNCFKPPKLERSDSFISLFRRKVSFEKKPPSMNSNWNVSLQNLQQIDNMVKYDDGLNFVDYDKFNQYEQKLVKQIQYENKLSENLTSVQSSVVVKRPKKISSSYRSDFTKNLDREKNVYRQSIDSNKLRFFSAMNDETDNRWSQDSDNRNPMDWLSLEDKTQYANVVHLNQMASSNTSIQPINTGYLQTLANSELQLCRNFWSCGNLTTPNAETIPFNPIMVS
ncbi:unnamed protein product [Diamesa serratosioi]